MSGNSRLVIIQACGDLMTPFAPKGLIPDIKKHIPARKHGMYHFNSTFSISRKEKQGPLIILRREKVAAKEPTICTALNNLCTRADSTRGASVCTSAAIYAYIRVNRIDLALRDSASGALIDASTASNAVITNYISHF